MKYNAAVVMFKCTREFKNKAFGVRFQETSEGRWERTWAFKLSENSAKREKYDRVRLKGSIGDRDDYPGCPYCGTRNYFLCDGCGGLNCWDGSRRVTCAHCRKSGEITEGVIDEIKAENY